MSYTAKQIEAKKLLCNPAYKHYLFYGGSRSGKTYLFVDAIVRRAIKAPGSRHAINRYRFNACKTSIGMETLPAVFSKQFPKFNYKIDKQEWICFLENGSEIWLNGLDDKDRTEKVLGKEYATILNNECSQITYSAYETMRTRLAQRIEDLDGNILRNVEYNDCNPPTKGHWTYKLFFKHMNPDDKSPILSPEKYAYMKMNPADNLENISEDYIQSLESLSAAKRKRFLFGEFSDENPNALFDENIIERNRLLDEAPPQYVRVVVAIDPSGASDSTGEGDEIGIVVVGLGIDGKAYVIEDLTLMASPKVWGEVAVNAFERHQANVIVAEHNYGGGMVKHVIDSVKKRIPYKPITATKAKHVRANPISALYEQNKVIHIGYLSKLEDELSQYSNVGYLGDSSPNRADALVMALTEIFPQITQEQQKFELVIPKYSGSWMGR